jgi:hypothetical protein
MFLVGVYIVRTAEVIKRPSDLFFDTDFFLGDVELSCFLFEGRGGFRIWSPDEGCKVEFVVEFDGAFGGGHAVGEGLYVPVDAGVIGDVG